MFFKQRRNADWAAKSIGKAVRNDFCEFDTLLCIEAFQELYQLQDEQTNEVTIGS